MQELVSAKTNLAILKESLRGLDHYFFNSGFIRCFYQEKIDTRCDLSQAYIVRPDGFVEGPLPDIPAQRIDKYHNRTVQDFREFQM